MCGGLVSVQGVSQQHGEVLRLYEGLRSLQRGQHPYEGSHVCTRGPTSERRGVVLIRSFIKSAWGGGTSTGSVGTSAWGCRIHPRGAPSSIPGVSPPSWGSPLHPGGVHLVPHHLSPPLAGLPGAHRRGAGHRDRHQPVPLLRREGAEGVPDPQRDAGAGGAEAAPLGEGEGRVWGHRGGSGWTWDPASPSPP